MDNSTEKVLTLLRQYPAKKRKIEQLRFELEHPALVSEDDLIKSLAIGGQELNTGGNSGHVTDKTMLIAMRYKEIADKINGDTLTQIKRELRALEVETGKLERYISLLTVRQKEVLRLRYIDGKAWVEIETMLHVNTRTLHAHHNAGVESLTEMYGFIDKITDKGE
jgi:DNA-directed RNA polymerase specialized sigma subunit